LGTFLRILTPDTIWSLNVYGADDRKLWCDCDWKGVVGNVVVLSRKIADI